jgi:hypothetical protein
MRRFSLVLGLIGAAFFFGNAFAASAAETGPGTPAPTATATPTASPTATPDVTLPATVCPTSATFTCGAAEVRPLTDPTSPGAPGVFVGYIAFDVSGVPIFYKLANLNGTIMTFPPVTGTCTPGTTTALGILDFTPTGPKFAFVRDSGGDELRLLTTADSGAAGGVTPSAVSLATCTHR